MRPLVVLLVRALICVVQTWPLSACTPPTRFLWDKQAVFADARFLISWPARFSCMLGHTHCWASSRNSRAAASWLVWCSLTAVDCKKSQPRLGWSLILEPTESFPVLQSTFARLKTYCRGISLLLCFFKI